MNRLIHWDPNATLCKMCFDSNFTKVHSKESNSIGNKSVSFWVMVRPLRWRHSESNGVWNYRRLDGSFNRLFRRRWEKSWKLRVTGLCEGSPPVTGGFSSHRPVTRKMFPFDDIIMATGQHPHRCRPSSLPHVCSGIGPQWFKVKCWCFDKLLCLNVYLNKTTVQPHPLLAKLAMQMILFLSQGNVLQVWIFHYLVVKHC